MPSPRVLARSLIARMTLEEKAGQCIYRAEAIPRLGIRAYCWWNESLHGVGRAGLATVFPQAIGLAATWDPALVRRVSGAIAREARAKHHGAEARGNRGIYSGLTFWSPTINILRDPRWGRGQETYGEDPHLTAEIATAYVRGLQGDDPDHPIVSACAKHFAAHSGPERIRAAFDARVSLRDLRETYLPAFEALVRRGRVESVMGAYNRLNGEPACGSPTLLEGILRREWGFQGHVVSDCGAIANMHKCHKVTTNGVESAALALSSGCDLHCGGTYHDIIAAVKSGILAEADLDRSVERLLELRIRLGDIGPASPHARIPASVVSSPAHRRLALRAAAESCVLLKNTGVLPLRPEQLASVSVTGPFADDPAVLYGNYHGLTGQATTILQGLAARLGGAVNLAWHPGCAVNGVPSPEGTGGLFHLTCAQPELFIAVVGLSPRLEGEHGDAEESDLGGDRGTLDLLPSQLALLKRLKMEGKPLIVVLTGGGPISSPWLAENADAILHVFYPGEAGGEAVAALLCGDISPSGRLPFTVPRSLDDLPPFEDYAMAGRTYRFSKAVPLWPFGFGLSYGRFAYRGLRTKVTRGGATPRVVVEAEVSNLGSIAADEVVQCYVQPAQTDSAQPNIRLAMFSRVTLKAGAQRRVRFNLGDEAFRVFAEDGTASVPAGPWRISVAGNQPGGEHWGGSTAVTTEISFVQPVIR